MNRTTPLNEEARRSNQRERVEEFIETCDEESLKSIRRVVNRRIKRLNEDRKSVKITVNYSLRSMEMARLLEERVRANYPFLKEPNLENWASDIDKIQRVDGRDFKMIEAVLRWSQEDDFWRKQIRSGGALRKHFEKLCVEVASKNSKGNTYSV